MIILTSDIYSQLVGMKYESCGVIYGNDKFNKIRIFRNISTENDLFRANWTDMLMWALKENWNCYCLWHKHKKSRMLSREDKMGMTDGILYLVVFNKMLFFYKKNKDEIEDFGYKVDKE